jgi:hypothetical protein
MFFPDRSSTDIDIVFSLSIFFSGHVSRRAHNFNGALRMRRYRRGHAAVQKVLEAVNVPGANEDGIGIPRFSLLDNDVRRVAFPADLSCRQTRRA